MPRAGRAGRRGAGVRPGAVLEGPPLEMLIIKLYGPRRGGAAGGGTGGQARRPPGRECVLPGRGAVWRAGAAGARRGAPRRYRRCK